MARYLSLDWIDDLRHEVAGNTQLATAAAGRLLGVTQVVTGGPEGDVVYHLQVDGGEVVFGAGPADPEHVRFVQDWDTAVAVATGTMNAQEAFIKGRVRFTGDQQLLLDSTPLFAALDGVFSSVRGRTTYE
jgi:putative sterol carrier protein